MSHFWVDEEVFYSLCFADGEERPRQKPHPASAMNFLVKSGVKYRALESFSCGLAKVLRLNCISQAQKKVVLRLLAIELHSYSEKGSCSVRFCKCLMPHHSFLCWLCRDQSQGDSSWHRAMNPYLKSKILWQMSKFTFGTVVSGLNRDYRSQLD